MVNSRAFRPTLEQPATLIGSRKLGRVPVTDIMSTLYGGRTDPGDVDPNGIWVDRKDLAYAYIDDESQRRAPERCG